jgi:hypothetical protein
MRLKFKVDRIEVGSVTGGEGTEVAMRNIVLVTSGETWGEIQIATISPEVWQQFSQGSEHNVEFTNA